MRALRSRSGGHSAQCTVARSLLRWPRRSSKNSWNTCASVNTHRTFACGTVAPHASKSGAAPAAVCPCSSPLLAVAARVQVCLAPSGNWRVLLYGGCVSRARRLTPRSRRGPTASHQGPAGGTRYIFAARALASCRRSRLTSNVRRRRNAPLKHRRVFQQPSQESRSLLHRGSTRMHQATSCAGRARGPGRHQLQFRPRRCRRAPWSSASVGHHCARKRRQELCGHIGHRAVGGH